jgi:hypothetical protein
MTRQSRLLILALICALSGLIPADAGAATPATPAGSAGELSIVLPLAARTAALQRFATAVATPSSPQYRHYRSIAWLSAHFGAGAGAEAKVVTYLRAHGATHVRVDATGLFVDATLTRARAEALFSTQLTRRGSRADAYTAPTRRATIPAALRGMVTSVVGLDTQPVLAAPARARARATTSRPPRCPGPAQPPAAPRAAKAPSPRCRRRSPRPMSTRARAIRPRRARRAAAGLRPASAASPRISTCTPTPTTGCREPAPRARASGLR